MMYHSFFIHSSVNGQLGCFHILAIVNSAAVNAGGHVSFSILLSSGYMPRSGTAGPYGCWEGLGAGGEGDNRGWDGWMASPTRFWMWVWVNSGSWWWTGRPGVLRFMGLQRVGHDWVTELNWTELNSNFLLWTYYMTLSDFVSCILVL